MANEIEQVLGLIEAGLDNTKWMQGEGRSEDWAIGWRMALEGLASHIRSPRMDQPTIELSAAFAELLDAKAFRERVRAATEEERIAAGTDAQDRLDAALARFVELSPRLVPEGLATGSIDLEIRLADCLADAIDAPLTNVVIPGDPADRKTSLLLGSFRPDIAERAAALLEECGR